MARRSDAPVECYSNRKAINGSIRAARIAGTILAIKETAPTMMATAMKVLGSTAAI